MNEFCVYSKNHPREVGLELSDWIWAKHLKEWRFIWKAVDTCEKLVQNTLTSQGIIVTSVERI